MQRIVSWLGKKRAAGIACYLKATSSLSARVRDIKGQGTVEYAILVGVLVVIAIFAVIAFKGKLQELWDSISSGIKDL